MSAQRYFGEVRSALQGTDPELAWYRTCALLDRMWPRYPDEVEDIWMPYIDGSLSRTMSDRHRRAPLKWLKIARRGKDMPLLGLVRTIEAERANFSDKMWGNVIRQEHMAEVRSINLSFNDISSRAVHHLARSPHVTRLRALYLWGTGIGDAAAEAIAQAEHLASLQTLVLPPTALGDRGRDAIAESPFLCEEIRGRYA